MTEAHYWAKKANMNKTEQKLTLIEKKNEQNWAKINIIWAKMNKFELY